MLSNSRRLRASAELRSTVRHGVRAGRTTLVVHAQQLSSPLVSDPTRVGFVVSKAVGGAVVRNRVKRRLRHLVRPLIDTSAGLRVVVRALPASATASSDELNADLCGAWDSVQRKLVP